MILWKLATTFLAADENNGTASTVDLDPLHQIPPPPSGDVGIAFVKMLITFIAIIVLLFGTYWLMRRLIQHRLHKGVGDPSIQILEKRMISPKTILYLVEVENKKILFAESHLEIKRLESFSHQTDLQPNNE